MSGMKRTRNIAVIQFYFYPDISAASQMLQDLLVGLSAESDWRFTVFCSDHCRKGGVPLPALGKLNDRLHIHRIRTLHLGKKSIASRLLEYSYFYLYVFFYFLFSLKWDCIVSLTSPPLIGVAAAAAVLWKRVPFIYYIQDLYPEILFDLKYVKSPRLINTMQLLNKLIFRRSQKIVTIGRWMSRKIQFNYHVPASALVEIPNWSKGIRALEPAPKKEINLLYSGNIGLAHDFACLPHLIRVLRRDERIAYTFIGEGKNKKSLAAIFDREGEKRVSFGGYIEREGLTGLLASAGMFIVAQTAATVGDILPSKIYAYLAAGRPILFLGPRLSETAELLVKNDIGAVIEGPDDATAAAAYIDFAFSRFDVYRGICARARALFDSQFAFSLSLKSFSRTLRSVLPGKGSEA